MDLRKPDTYTLTVCQTVSGCQLDPPLEYTIIVVEPADIDLPGLADAVEEDSPGAFVRVNDDDDNDSGIDDLLDTGTVAGENDLVAVSTSTPANGSWQLSCSPVWAVRFWRDSARTQPLNWTSPGYYEGTGVLGTLYMEGMYPTLLGGLRITLTAREPDEIQCSDSVVATVVQCKIVWPKKPIWDHLVDTFIISDDGSRRQSNQAAADNADVLGAIEQKRLHAVVGIVQPLELLWEIEGSIGTLDNYEIEQPTHIPPSATASGKLRLKARYPGKDTGIEHEVPVEVFEDHLDRDVFNFRNGKWCTIHHDPSLPPGQPGPQVGGLQLADNTETMIGHTCGASASHAAFGANNRINDVKAWTGPTIGAGVDGNGNPFPSDSGVYRGDALELKVIVNGAAAFIHWETVREDGPSARQTSTFAGDALSEIFRYETPEAYYSMFWDKGGANYHNGFTDKDLWIQHNIQIHVHRHP